MTSVGARLHRTGSVFARVTDLLKSGVVAYDDRPLWYDVYKAFPPIREPKYISDPEPDELGLVNVEDNVRPILYHEDWARATFNAQYKQEVKAVPVCMMTNPDPTITPTQSKGMRFVQKFRKVQKDFPNLSKEEIFDKTLKLMNIPRRPE